MEKEALRSNNNWSISNNNTHRNGADGGLLLRSISDGATKQQTTPDLLLQWGSRKRLRCMKKVQLKDQSTALVNRTTVRVDRRVVRAGKEAASNQPTPTSNGYFNLRQRPSSPPAPPSQRVLRQGEIKQLSSKRPECQSPPKKPKKTASHKHHTSTLRKDKTQSDSNPSLRNSENSSAMRGQSNGGVRKLASPDRGTHDKRGSNHNHHENNHNNRSGASSETAHDSKKGGSSTGSGEAAATQPTVWPPKFVIALTNKEKEEDFFAFKGSKLPQRPKKRSKFIQRTLNLVSPGTWLCDLTLDRYEVREKKASKKKPRGLKALGNMESESE